MLPTAYVSHSMRGRTRFRIPECKGDADYFFRIEKSFAALDGVSYVAANPLSGSLLLLHGLDDAALIHHAQQEQLFSMETKPVLANPGLHLASTQLARLDRALKQITSGAFSMEELVFDLLLAASFVQLVRGRVLGPSATILSYAASVLAIHRARQTGE